MHILLDLDHTIISSLPLVEEMGATADIPTAEDKALLKLMFAEHFILGNKFVLYERPHLQAFLDRIFKAYTVSVCTAASQGYAADIIEKVILRNGRQLKYVFWNSHGVHSAEACNGNHKCIKFLRNIMKTDDRVILIDDTPNWALGQKDNVIIVPAFNIGKSLKQGEDSIVELAKDRVLLDLDVENAFDE